jgi:hypothetical protein
VYVVVVNAFVCCRMRGKKERKKERKDKEE